MRKLATRLIKIARSLLSFKTDEELEQIKKDIQNIKLDIHSPHKSMQKVREIEKQIEEDRAYLKKQIEELELMRKDVKNINRGIFGSRRMKNIRAAKRLLKMAAEFVDPHNQMKAERPYDKDELIRALRKDLAAEEEAVSVYTTHAEMVKNELAKKVLLDVANEERVHAGEFQKLICLLDDKEKELLSKGHGEVDDVVNRINGKGEKSMDNKKLAKQLLKLASELVAADTFPCPKCGTKVLEQTKYCVKCKEKVQPK